MTEAEKANELEKLNRLSLERDLRDGGQGVSNPPAAEQFKIRQWIKRSGSGGAPRVRTIGRSVDF